MTLVFGKQLIRDAVTEEDFTIGIDPTLSTEPVGYDKVVITNQTIASAVNNFKTIPAAINALPDTIGHTVTLNVVAGDHVLDGDFLGNYERFRFIPTPSVGQGNWTTGNITIQSSLIRVPGTSTYSVSAYVGARTIQGTGPGLVDDAYQGYMLRVVSGTGAGQVRAIRKNTDVLDTQFDTVGQWSPALVPGSSVVEIVRPAAKLQVSPSAYGYPRIQGNWNYVEYIPSLILKNLWIWGDPADGRGYFAPERIGMMFEDCMMKVFNMYAADSYIVVKGGSWEGDDTSTGRFWHSVIGGRSGYFELSWNDARGILVYNTTGNGVSVGFPGEVSNGTLIYTGIVFETVGLSAAQANAIATQVWDGGGGAGGWNSCYNVGEYGVRIRDGGVAHIMRDPYSSQLNGALGELCIDDDVIDYDEIYDDPDEVVHGTNGSRAYQRIGGFEV